MRRDIGGPPNNRFVGQGPCALPWVRENLVRADVGIGPYEKGCRGGRPQGSPLRRVTRGAVRNPPVTASPCQPPLGKGAKETGVRTVTASVRTGFAMTHCKECGRSGRCGERTERCQWQRKRSERVAAVKISSVRRKAAQKFWAPQQDHRPLRGVYR